MAAVESTMLDLGTIAPEFTLPSVTGGSLSLNDYSKKAKGTVIAFICNHCPFVIHINQGLVKVAEEYLQKGIGFVAISSNDALNYPSDSPELMAEVSKYENYPFAYLYDENQQVAKDYKAACTPDFFVFDENKKLVYRGRFDESRPGNDKPINGSDLRIALDRLLMREAPLENQIPSIGCNIKWKIGNEPDYFG